MSIYVINKYGKPLIPHKERKAKILLKQNKVKVINKTPFTTQLMEKRKLLIFMKGVSFNMKIKKRFRDEAPIYNIYRLIIKNEGKILVKCPKCSGKAEIINNLNNSKILLKCCECSYIENRQISIPIFHAQGICRNCERWFNIAQPKECRYHMVKIKCPNCGEIQTAYTKHVHNYYVDIINQLELYLKSQFRGHIIWAYNYEHLNYLIEWISSDLREHHVYVSECGQYIKLTSGQSQKLPTWTKKAKNRNKLIKVLKKIQSTT